MPLSDLQTIFPHPGPAGAATPLCTVMVDAEEDFDWDYPMQGTSNDVSCMRNLADFQSILAAYGAVPTYLLTYPVLRDRSIAAGLRGRIARGECEAGVQLHTWVTPPFDEAVELRNSFGANLDAGLEERKLLELMAAFRDVFGHDPTAFRAGRYGLGPRTPLLLEKHGFCLDTSLAPRTMLTSDDGGDFSAVEYGVFWFGAQRRLLEIPLCRDIVGWGGYRAAQAYRRLEAAQPQPNATAARYLAGLLAWTRCAERITLSPEGNDVSAAARLVSGLLSRGQTVLTLSLHSSSLSAGRNPYVRNRSDLHHFYDRLSAMLDMLSGRFAMRFVVASQLPALLAAGTSNGG